MLNFVATRLGSQKLALSLGCFAELQVTCGFAGPTRLLLLCPLFPTRTQLESPRHVHAVDMNPRQNALLELKMVGIRHLQYEDFFEMFGRGRLKYAVDTYHQGLRGSLSAWSQQYWDRWIRFFDNRQNRFGRRGKSNLLEVFGKILGSATRGNLAAAIRFCHGLP